MPVAVSLSARLSLFVVDEVGAHYRSKYPLKLSGATVDSTSASLCLFYSLRASCLLAKSESTRARAQPKQHVWSVCCELKINLQCQDGARAPLQMSKVSEEL